MILATIKTAVSNIRSIPLRQQLHHLRQSQFLGASEYATMQRTWLCRMLKHAYECVPYYHDVFQDLGWREQGDLVDPEEFRRIPFLTKEIIRKERNRLVSSDLSARRWYPNTSGGSTGEPVRLIQDIDFWHWDVACKMLF
ncbi:MAG: hypothetical protein ACUVSF_14020, partial [Anaerolineae bacterium]